MSMVVSAWVEHQRLSLYHDGHFHKSQEAGLHHMKIVDMSVFWQIPQYLLVGLSEVCAARVPPQSSTLLLTALHPRQLL